MGRRAALEGGGAATIILKREEVVEGGHHGGAWKVAYADFVTAMMAFFLLMWLLNATSEEQRRGLADYFAPANVFGKSTSGTGQPFGGKTLNSEGELASDAGAIRVERGPVPVRLDIEDEDGEAPLTPNARDPGAPPAETVARAAEPEAREVGTDEARPELRPPPPPPVRRRWRPTPRSRPRRLRRRRPCRLAGGRGGGSPALRPRAAGRGGAARRGTLARAGAVRARRGGAARDGAGRSGPRRPFAAARGGAGARGPAHPDPRRRPAADVRVRQGRAHRPRPPPGAEGGAGGGAAAQRAFGFRPHRRLALPRRQWRARQLGALGRPRQRGAPRAAGGRRDGSAAAKRDRPRRPLAAAARRALRRRQPAGVHHPVAPGALACRHALARDRAGDADAGRVRGRRRCPPAPRRSARTVVEGPRR